MESQNGVQKVSEDEKVSQTYEQQTNDYKVVEAEKFEFYTATAKELSRKPVAT